MRDLRWRKGFILYRDLTAEQSDILKEKNRELIDRQDYEIELATLNERTRIAREIHDNVGHLLTRSILQVSALQVVMRNENIMAVPLAELKDSLEDAMDNIRSSVHDLHDDALNLELSLRSLTDSFSFCPVRLDYEAGKAAPAGGLLFPGGEPGSHLQYCPAQSGHGGIRKCHGTSGLLPADYPG